MINKINITSQFNPRTPNIQKGVEYSTPSKLERQPENDTLNISKTANSKTKKTALILGGLGTLAVGTILAVKKAGKGSSYIEKAQKMFQEAFMRDNISIKETKTILKRYKEIEKIENKEEYIEALYKQAIKDYKLEHLKFSLDIADLKKGTLGAMNPAGEFTISKNASREKIRNIVFHEFRHAKQNDLMASSDMNKYISGILNRKSSERIIKNSKEYKEALKFLTEKGIDDTYLLNRMKENFKPKFIKMIENMNYGKAEIPKNETISNMINKFFEGHSNYVEPSGLISMFKYHNNFLEKDARRIGEGMRDLLKNIPNID